MAQPGASRWVEGRRGRSVTPRRLQLRVSGAGEWAMELGCGPPGGPQGERPLGSLDSDLSAGFASIRTEKAWALKDGAICQVELWGPRPRE